jgi:isopenicillin N synthase-like dioxygenase
MPVAVEAETLPTLDLRRFEGHGSERSRFLEDLRKAARSVGFFYLVGHGIEDGLIQDVLKVSRLFFALPEKDKLAIEMVNSPHFRGYNRAGFEHTRGKPDWREQSTSGRKGRRCPSTERRRHGRACRVRTNGRRRSRSSSPPFSPIRMRPLR